MKRLRASVIGERIRAELVTFLSEFHPLIHRRPEDDLLTYWRGLPEDKRTFGTAAVFAIQPFVFWGFALLLCWALFVGELWMLILVAVGGGYFRSYLRRHYWLRIAQSTTAFEQDYPALFADYDVSTQLLSKGGGRTASVMRYLGRSYILLDPDEIRKMPSEEIKATIAHELGHHHYRDRLRKIVVEWVAVLPRVLALWVIVRAFDPFTLIAVIGAAITGTWVVRWQSRQHEYRADRFSVNLTGEKYPTELMLFRMQFSDLRGDTMLGKLGMVFSTHPLASARLQHIQGYEPTESVE